MNYHLVEACQNTFLLLDCLNTPLNGEFFKQVHQTLLKEQRDDALILCSPKVHGQVLHLTMLVLGQDGTFGEFCGNGARACAAYLYATYPQYKQFVLQTSWGSHPLIRCPDGEYAVQLPLPSFSLNCRFIQEVPPHCHYVEMIEPHLIVEANLSDKELFQLGRELNAKKEQFPLGINVNAWHRIDQNLLFVKTYERGVQRLTKSCGTGSAACAAFYNQAHKLQVKTPGGLLEIEIKNEGILLKGAAN